MFRSAASKVMWVGKAIVFLVGLTMILALWLALQFALANPAQATHRICEIDPETGTRICVPGLHSAPDVTVNGTSVTVNEGQTATNSGTYDDTFDDDLNETVSFSASEGTLTKTGTESGTWSWSRSNAQNPGSRTVTITATDSTGRSSSTSFTLNVNNIAPSATLTSPSSGAFLKGTVPFSANAFDPGSINRVEFLINGGVVGTDTTAPYSMSWNSATVPDGARTVSARAFDNQGASFSQSVSVTVDNTLPAVSITAGPSGSVGSSSATFSFSASDTTSGLSSVECKLDEGAFEPCSTSKSYAGLSNGKHTFSVRAADSAGNVTIVSRSWTVDTVKPTVSGMSPRHTLITRDTTPTITATVKDRLTNLQKRNIKLYVNGKLISSIKYSYSAATNKLTYNSPKLPKGKKTVKIVATDAAKNVATKSWYFTIK